MMYFDDQDILFGGIIFFLFIEMCSVCSEKIQVSSDDTTELILSDDIMELHVVNPESLSESVPHTIMKR